jgi:radical SAM enzyme (TIGR01210 family)
LHAYSSLWEEERNAAGVLAPTAVILLTNRECPFRCVMCDLWVNTLDRTVPPGAIQTQIRTALAALPPVRQVKLYNAGSFFDPQAIPAAEDEGIASEVHEFERVVVEAHPAFLAGIHGERCVAFRNRLHGRLEVAIGLETANRDVLARLNKRMTLESFQRAAEFLQSHDIDLRVFVLLNPPFLPAAEGVEWACRSLDLAVASGATAASIIPTRGGNGAMEALGAGVTRPRVNGLEQVVEYGLTLGAMRVFADVWDIERFHDCACSPARAARLRDMNLTQRVPDRVTCDCDSRAAVQP